MPRFGQWEGEFVLVCVRECALQDALIERATFHQLHDQRVLPEVFRQAVKLDDVGMREHRERVGLPDEELACPGASLEEWVQRLDGDAVIRASRERAARAVVKETCVDDTHPALADALTYNHASDILQSKLNAAADSSARRNIGQFFPTQRAEARFIGDDAPTFATDRHVA